MLIGSAKVGTGQCGHDRWGSTIYFNKFKSNYLISSHYIQEHNSKNLKQQIYGFFSSLSSKRYLKLRVEKLGIEISAKGGLTDLHILWRFCLRYCT